MNSPINNNSSNVPTVIGTIIPIDIEKDETKNIPISIIANDINQEPNTRTDTNTSTNTNGSQKIDLISDKIEIAGHNNDTDVEVAVEEEEEMEDMEDVSFNQLFTKLNIILLGETVCNNINTNLFLKLFWSNNQMFT